MSQGDGKLFIGYDYCDVYDSIDIRRCFKCNGFNHFSSHCSIAKHICPRCGEEHPVNDCKAQTLKCINCVKLQASNKDSSLDTNHAAWDNRCPIYSQKLTEFKTKMYVA